MGVTTRYLPSGGPFAARSRDPFLENSKLFDPIVLFSVVQCTYSTYFVVLPELHLRSVHVSSYSKGARRVRRLWEATYFRLFSVHLVARFFLSAHFHRCLTPWATLDSV